MEVVRDICAGKLDGGHVGSCSVTFRPGNIQSGTFLTDTKTAGSVASVILLKWLAVIATLAALVEVYALLSAILVT